MSFANPTSSDSIILEGIEFYAYHGASDEEQAIGHRYVVDVRLVLDLQPAGISDDLGQTVNYAEVCAVILEVGTGQRFRLLERLAEATAAILLDRFPISEVHLKVGKRLPPLGAVAEFAGVEIVRQRFPQNQANQL